MASEHIVDSGGGRSLPGKLEQYRRQPGTIGNCKAHVSIGLPPLQDSQLCYPNIDHLSAVMLLQTPPDNIISVQDLHSPRRLHRSRRSAGASAVGESKLMILPPPSLAVLPSHRPLARTLHANPLSHKWIRSLFYLANAYNKRFGRPLVVAMVIYGGRPVSSKSIR